MRRLLQAWHRQLIRDVVAWCMREYQLDGSEADITLTTDACITDLVENLDRYAIPGKVQ